MEAGNLVLGLNSVTARSAPCQVSMPTSCVMVMPEPGIWCCIRVWSSAKSLVISGPIVRVTVLAFVVLCGITRRFVCVGWQYSGRDVAVLPNFCRDAEGLLFGEVRFTGVRPSQEVVPVLNEVFCFHGCSFALVHVEHK